MARMSTNVDKDALSPVKYGILKRESTPTLEDHSSFLIKLSIHRTAVCVHRDGWVGLNSNIDLLCLGRRRCVA